MANNSIQVPNSVVIRASMTRSSKIYELRERRKLTSFVSVGIAAKCVSQKRGWNNPFLFILITRTGIRQIPRERIFASSVRTVMRRLTRIVAVTSGDRSVNDEKKRSTHPIVQKSGYNHKCSDSNPNVGQPTQIVEAGSIPATLTNQSFRVRA